MAYEAFSVVSKLMFVVSNVQFETSHEQTAARWYTPRTQKFRVTDGNRQKSAEFHGTRGFAELRTRESRVGTNVLRVLGKMLAGGPGFEPGFSESESDVLPLDDPPAEGRAL